MNRIVFGDCRDTLRLWAAEGVQAQMCVTSPPYFGLRDYNVAGQLGLESSPQEYIAAMVEVFRGVREVLADDGVLWLNIGDSYAGSWGNYGGQNRGQGTQRPIVSGSATQSRAYEGKEQWRPPTSNKMDGIKNKDLIGIPWMLAFALRADGWYLRQDIVWHKPNCMPESVRDRCTKAHEYLFLLSKSPRYYFDQEAIQEPVTGQAHPRGTGVNPKAAAASNHPANTFGNKQNSAFSAAVTDLVDKRNRRSVWTVATRPYKGAHFATFPPELIVPCILAGSRPGQIVLDPFMGSGTTAAVALAHGRQYLGCELNTDYAALQVARITAAEAGLQPVLSPQSDLFEAA